MDIETASMIVNCAAYGADGNRLADITVDQISEVLARDDGGFVWIGLCEPDEPLLQKLQNEFGLHDLAVEDAHNAHQRPKIDIYGDSLFIVLNTAQTTNGKVKLGETHIFLGKHYLVSVRHGASLSYAPARARCEREPAMLALGPSYALYAMLDYAVDNYLPLVSEFQAELQKLEQDIFAEDYKRSTIERLYELRQQLTTLRMAVSPLQDVLNQLARFHPTLIREEVRVYFRDVFDHVVRANEAIDTMRELLTAAMSVNLALVTLAQGEIVKRLAGWAALLAVPTLITGWYGMNFHNMPELSGTYAYYVMIGVTVAVCAILYVVLRRARWL
jgi:magnesium transporter